ncbi:unnamed protein product [Symbiodinium natans]|uniref:Uncharacterized protein n=1 Tax=Symbiodinium natans TaxID=878477 RepID=A0A812R7J9_9DINO|nr:unnamed protein product [Symbiodinium natans]
MAQEVRRVSAELRSLAAGGGVDVEAAAAEARDVHQQLSSELSCLSLSQNQLDLHSSRRQDSQPANNVTWLEDEPGHYDHRSPSRSMRAHTSAGPLDASKTCDTDQADMSTRFEPTGLSSIPLSLRDSFETLQQLERQLAGAAHAEVPADEALHDAAAEALRITTLLRRCRRLEELLRMLHEGAAKPQLANQAPDRKEGPLAQSAAEGGLCGEEELRSIANFGLKSDSAVRSGKLLISSEIERLRSLSDLLDQRSRLTARVGAALRPACPVARSLKVSKSRANSSASGFDRRSIHHQLHRSWHSSMDMDGYLRDQLRFIQQARSRFGPTDLKPFSFREACGECTEL